MDINWIKISKKLPVDKTDYLCYGYGHPIFKGMWSNSFQKFFDEKGLPRNVTHYMVLPEIPKD